MGRNGLCSWRVKFGESFFFSLSSFPLNFPASSSMQLSRLDFSPLPEPGVGCARNANRQGAGTTGRFSKEEKCESRGDSSDSLTLDAFKLRPNMLGGKDNERCNDSVYSMYVQQMLEPSNSFKRHDPILAFNRYENPRFQ